MDSWSGYVVPKTPASCSKNGSSYNSSFYHQNSGDSQCQLLVSDSSSISQSQLRRLFDLVLGLDFSQQKLEGKVYSLEEGIQFTVQQHSVCLFCSVLTTTPCHIQRILVNTVIAAAIFKHLKLNLSQKKPKFKISKLMMRSYSPVDSVVWARP